MDMEVVSDGQGNLTVKIIDGDGDESEIIRHALSTQAHIHRERAAQAFRFNDGEDVKERMNGVASKFTRQANILSDLADAIADAVKTPNRPVRYVD